VTNSADKSPINPANLSEDSDVIELTEEIGARQAAGLAAAVSSLAASSDPDDLGFEIPEFRLPGASAEVEAVGMEEDSEPELATQRLSSLDSASLSGAMPNFGAEPMPQSRPHQAQPEQPLPLQLDDMDIELPDDFDNTMLVEANSEVIEEVPDDQLEEDVFDRQEMVKTIQLQAVDRAVLERELEIETLARAALVTDQRFSPDVVITPPRVLAKRWMEGSPISDTNRPTAQHPKVPPRPMSGAFQRPVVDDEQVPEIEFEPDEEVVTTVAPAPQRPAAPSSQQPRVPPRPIQATAPTPVAAPPVAAQAPAPRPAPRAGDAEMNDLVSELLEEAKPAKPAAPVRTPGRENWSQTVFTEEYLRTMPRDLERISERDVDFIDASLSLQSGSRILDLACGIGRHAMIMARRGYEVAGMDLSMPLLQIALNEAQKRSIPVKFVHGDMRSMNFASIFDGCYCWQTSFGYFDDPTNFKVLQGIHRALKPGGRFLLDVINRDYIIGDMPNRAWWEGKECIFLEEVDFDNTQSLLHTKRSYIYEDGTPPLEQNFYIRLYSLHELLNLMQGAGFRVLEVSGELHQRAHFLGASSTRLLILAERPIK
jgi:SAM-dependent methyltransferase